MSFNCQKIFLARVMGRIGIFHFYKSVTNGRYERIFKEIWTIL